MLRLYTTLLLALLLGACDERGPDHTESSKTPPEPFDLKENLSAVFGRAIKDFADYEMTHRNPEWPRRTFRLDHQGDEVEVWGNGGFDTVAVPPGVFDGIDFDTALGEHLLNGDEPFPTQPKNPVRTIGVRRICFSEPQRKLQISIGWADTISESWTFLYDLTNEGQFMLKKAVMLGCNTPDGWIDGPF